MEKVLEIQQLTKRFGNLIAVNNISFTVEKGNVYGLLGPNGSGKSTTLGMLLDTINPTSGSWSWFGNFGTSTHELKRIGAIIEHPNFYPYLSGEKNLEIVCTIKEVSMHRIDEVLELVGLEKRKKDKFSNYSLGMKQRLAIAAAMLNEPEVLILDEPTNGLDPQGIIQVRNIIQEIAQKGTTILLASHLLDEVEKVCSHVIILKQGKALYSGSVDGMNTNLGYFELEAEKISELANFVEKLPQISKVKVEGKKVLAYLGEELKSEDLNQLLFENKIVLSKLIRHKTRLEDQFLELVKN